MPKREFRGKSVRTNGAAYRPSKLAAGMAATAKRSNHWPGNNCPPALTLSVRGTLDEIAHTLAFRIERHKSTCPCCRQATFTVGLNNSGRYRLAVLRSRKELAK